MQLNEITGQIVDAAMKIHTALGPGLLEAAYHACLVHELGRRGIRTRSEVPVPVVYDGVRVDAGFRMDVLVEEQVVVEIKSVEALAPIHQAQLLTYLRLSERKVGLLFNFNVVHLKDGITRMVNKL